jgi:hypothetical protein
MADRAELKRQAYAAISNGYATHRVMNRILNELAAQIIDSLYDEIEALKKELNHGSNEAKKDAFHTRRKESTTNEVAHA